MEKLFKNSIKLYFKNIFIIAYNLGLYDIGNIHLISSVGKDFKQLGYLNHFSKFKNIFLDLEINKNKFTAICYIVNDVIRNQNIIFHEVAMKELININLYERIIKPKTYFYSIITTLNSNSICKFTNILYQLRNPIIFDPGQKTSLLTKKHLLSILKKSNILIGNKYEIDLIKDKLNMSNQDLLKIIKIIIITNGENGSKLIYIDNMNKKWDKKVPICKFGKETIDATGAGDAYRAGLLIGLILELPLLDCCRLGSVVSSFVVETIGPQTHWFNKDNIKKRFLETFCYIPKNLKDF